MYEYMYVCMYVDLFVCVCVCVCVYKDTPIECDGFKIALLMNSIKSKKNIKENH
jgi:hypothetical protein